MFHKQHVYLFTEERRAVFICIKFERKYPTVNPLKVKPRGIYLQLIREQVTYQHGCENDYTNDYKNYGHADSHILQVLHKRHGIEIQINCGRCKK